MVAGDKLFRFEHLDVWQRAADVAFPLGRVADGLAERHLSRYSDQLRGAAISISNNIAEGRVVIPTMISAIFSTLPTAPPLRAQTCC